MYPAAIVRFNKDHDFEVYSARIAAGLPVRNSQIIHHKMVGKVVYVDGNRYYVDRAFKSWDRGYYVVLSINNFNDSHGQLYFETIGNCHSEFVLETIAQHRSKATFKDEGLGEKELKKIEHKYKIERLLHSELVRKNRDWKEERAMVEKEGLLTP